MKKRRTVTDYGKYEPKDGGFCYNPFDEKFAHLIEPDAKQREKDKRAMRKYESFLTENQTKKAVIKHSDLFDACIKFIEEAYATLGFNKKWHFLYSPFSTFSCPNGLMFLGLNPGGGESDCEGSVERGNDYVHGNWGKGNGLVLQKQVKRLFDLLAKSYCETPTSGIDLLEKTLTSNLCPFPSKSWEDLGRKKETIEYSKKLWKMVLSEVMPRIIICMGDVSYHGIRDVLCEIYGKDGKRTKMPTGYGKQVFKIRRFDAGGKSCTLVKIPHLSRFKLMRNYKCIPYVEAFIKKTCEIAR